jgi:hypothetical protein
MQYLDVQMWQTIKMEVSNFHLLEIPRYNSHKGEKMINVVSKVLDALYASFSVYQLMVLVP